MLKKFKINKMLLADRCIYDFSVKLAVFFEVKLSLDHTLDNVLLLKNNTYIFYILTSENYYHYNK